MGRTQKAKALVKELERKIKISKIRKKRILDYLSTLKESYSKGKISSEKYQEILQKDVGEGRTLEEWIEYYDLYIRDCERKINPHLRKKKKKNFLAIFLSIAFVTLLLSSIFIFNLSFTGFTVQEFENLTQENITENITEVLPEINISEEINKSEAPLKEDLSPSPEELPASEEITTEDATITTIQSSAILGQPVKWTKKIIPEKTGNLKISLPNKAENIQVNKIKDNKETTGGASITGGVIGTTEDSSIILKISNFFKNFFRKLFGSITGAVVNQGQGQLQKNEVDVEIDEITEYEIEYETPAPYAIEENLENGKRIKIIGPDTIHYENVLAFTELDESLNIKNPNKIKIKWIEENIYLSPSSVQDKNNDGIYDYIEWIVQGLSEQTFEIVIVSAEHLNTTRNYVTDIYDEVNETDNVTYTIPKNHYARAYFERELTNENFIDVYVKNSGQATIEIYEKDSNEIIATIDVNGEGLYYTPLDFEGSESVFDLKSVEDDIVYDFIHDIKPSYYEFNHLTCAATTSTTISTGETVTVSCTVYQAYGGAGSDQGSAFTGNFYGQNSTNDIDFSNTLTSSNTVYINASSFSSLALASVNSETAYQLDFFLDTFDIGGTYYIRAYANDDSTANVELTSNSIQVTVQAADETPPYFTSIPANASLWYGNESLGVDFDADDAVEFDSFSINDTAQFSINSSGWLSNTTSLAVGNYAVNVTINDTSNNINWTLYTIEINQSHNGCNVLFNETSPITYPSVFTVYTDCDSTFTLYRNGTAIDNNSVQNNGAGAFNFTVMRTDTENYTNTYDEEQFIVSKGTLSGSLTSTKGWTYEYDGASTTISYTESNPGDSDVEYDVWRDNQDIGSGETVNLAVNTYSYILNASKSSNYSEIALIDSQTLTINSNTSSCGVYFNETSPLNYPGTFLVWANCTSSFVLKRNNTIISNNSKQELEIGAYNFSMLRDDTTNYSYIYNESMFRVIEPSNTAPTIPWVQSIAAQNPTDDTTTSITFNFTVTDENGYDNINVSTVNASFIRAGEPTRINESCINYSQSGNNMNFTCTIDMLYFDENGDWTINVSIRDNEGEYAENSSTSFTYNILPAMKISPTSLEWNELSLTSTDVGSNNDPIIINNTGNDPNLNINVTAYNLRGEDKTDYFIYANNFTIGIASEGCSGITMSNATSLNITTALLTRGNHSINDGETGQEQLYFCIKGVPVNLPSQSYSSSAYGSWEIRVLLVAVIPRKRRKKKPKKKEKSLEDNQLLQALDLIIGKIKEEHPLEKEKLIKIVLGKLNKKYNIGRKEFLEIIKAREGISIPVNIFNKKLGALEAITKYMKENLNRSYRDIARELKRDERTIWTAYKKAIEKQKEKIEIKETKINLPISIFEDKKFTILESTIIYLKKEGFKFSEIGKLLDRDPRNIQTIYSRTIKKIK